SSTRRARRRSMQKLVLSEKTVARYLRPLPRHPFSPSTDTRSSGPWSRRHGPSTVLSLDPCIDLAYAAGLVGGPKRGLERLLSSGAYVWTHRQTQPTSTGRPRSASISATCSYASGYLPKGFALEIPMTCEPT